jgi:protocatechuate 3,4-dioxygenase beta subunit
MLNNPAFFRRDVTEGRPGLPLTLTITVVNTRTSCGPLADAAVEIWQCDAAGNYSEYGQSSGQTFLRGLQTTDSGGKVTFNTIYPGWYMGRATHIHVEIYVNGRTVKTTQIAFPESISASVYRTGVYASKGLNTTTNASDNVFSDGVQDEMAALSGDAASGYTGTITVGVSV